MMPLHRISENKPPIIQELDRLGFAVFSGSRGYDLNIIGARNPCTEANKFDDFLHVCYVLNGKWVEMIYACTTDPGSHWLNHPMMVDGTAILCHPQQIKGAFHVGLHRGKYKCLRQRPGIKIKCWRDNNRDQVLDIEQGQEFDANYIQIHKAGRASINVNKWSAGCTVIQNETEYNHFMGLVHKQIDNNYGTTFTYTIVKGIFL